MRLQNDVAFYDIAQNALAHPGFTGRDYDFNGNGTLIIGMNRGGSSVSAVDAYEARAQAALLDRADLKAYQTLSDRSFELLDGWNLWRRNLLILLTRASVPVSTVAYIHAVPFRVVNNKCLNKLYNPVWKKFTYKQVSALNPGRIIFAGSEVGKSLSSLTSIRSVIVPRTGRDIAYPNHNGVIHAKRVAEAHDKILSDADFWKG